jgi:uncharacterized protein (DUF2062 family)
MKHRLRRWLPTPEKIREARWARWLGPSLHHPRLWHFSRKGISLGFSIGIFFGLLIPFGQIPLAGGTAILLRANVPVAMASTFISNPVTFPAIYYLAYKLGVLLVGVDESRPPPPGFEDHGAWPDPLLIEQHVAGTRELGFFAATWARLEAMGKPLLVGLAVMSVAGGLLAHGGANLLWRLNARLAWRRRLRERARRRAAAASASAVDETRGPLGS